MILQLLHYIVNIRNYVIVVNIACSVYTICILILILLLIIGASFVYLSQNNLVPVTLHLGVYAFSNVPLFYIIIGSLIVGLGLAYLIYLVNSIFAAFVMRGKDNTIKRGNSDIVELTKQIHQLELENERLKNNSSVEEPNDTNAL